MRLTSLLLAAAFALTGAAVSAEDLGPAIERILQRNGVPGAGIAVVTRDGSWAAGFGKADLATGAPVTADTLFRVGSISKSFVAACLLELQEEGRVNLDTPLQVLLPEIGFSNPWQATDPLRLVHVLEHTAGFDDMRFNEMYDLQGRSPPPLEALAVNPRSRFVRWRPGTRPSYSNVGYTVAAAVIERLEKSPFEQVIATRLLRPLGMDQSDFRLTPAVKERLAQGYAANGKPIPYLAILHRAAGSLHASPAELARFVRMLLRRGELDGRRVLRPDSVERMEVPRSTLAARSGLRVGYGLGNYAETDAPFTVHGHDGAIDGFLSSCGYIPELGAGYVVLLNSSGSARALDELKRLLLRHLTRGVARPAPPPFELPDDELRHFAGVYRLANPRQELLRFLTVPLGIVRVQAKDGRLWAKSLLGPRVELIPEGPNRFRIAGQSEASLIFVEDAGGRRVLAGPLLYAAEVGTWQGYVPAVLLLAVWYVLRSLDILMLFWVPLRWLGAFRGLELLRMPMLAALCLFEALSLLLGAPLSQLGTMNARTVAVCALTWLFAALATLGLVRSMRARRLWVSRAVLLYARGTTLALCGLALYLAWWRVLGLRTWAW